MSTSPALKRILGGEAKDALVFTGSNLLRRFGSFLLVPLYWKRLTPADYGVLAVIAILASFQQVFSVLGADLSITRFFYVWPEDERRRNLGAIWIWSWINTLLWGGLTMVVLPPFSAFLFPDTPYDPYLWLGIIANSLAHLFLIPASVVRISRMPWLFAFSNLAGFAVSTGLGIYFVVVLDQGLRGMLMSMIWSSLIMAGVGAAIMLRLSQPCLSSPGFREALKFSLPAIPSNLMNTAGSVLDRFLLNQFASLETLGIYSVSMRFAELISGLHQSLKMAYGPFMMKHLSEDKEHGRATVTAVTPYYLLPYLAGAVGIVYFIGPFVRLINQPEYFAVVDWVPWLVGIAVLSSFYFYYTNGLFLGNRTDLLVIPTSIQLGSLVAACAVFIPLYQLPGLVLSRYISVISYVSVSLYMSQRVFPLPHQWGKLALLILGGALWAVLGAFLKPSSIALEILLKALALTVFVGVSYRFLSRSAAQVEAPL